MTLPQLRPPQTLVPAPDGAGDWVRFGSPDGRVSFEAPVALRPSRDASGPLFVGERMQPFVLSVAFAASGPLIRATPEGVARAMAGRWRHGFGIVGEPQVGTVVLDGVEAWIACASFGGLQTMWLSVARGGTLYSLTLSHCAADPRGRAAETRIVRSVRFPRWPR